MAILNMSYVVFAYQINIMVIRWIFQNERLPETAVVEPTHLAEDVFDGRSGAYIHSMLEGPLRLA